MFTATTLHQNWEFIETRHEGRNLGYSKAGWLPAEVPGHVHVDLMAAGIIPDPHLRMNEIGVQWVDETDWSYRTKFQFEGAQAKKQVLRFEGLDTVCTVSLNGEVLAKHDNMFVPLEVDVTGKLVVGENELRVDFESAVRVGEERMAEYLQGKPGYERLLERSFVRKVQCMYGWDWGPRLVSAGIWKPVTLLDYDARLLDVHVTQTHHEDGSVTIHIDSEVEGEAELTHLLATPDGTDFYSIEGDGDLHIEMPELWWPAGCGDQPLYTLHSSYGEDYHETELGLRTVLLVEEPDEHGTSFEFVVNGKRVWIRGANWIPDHSFPSIITKERLRDQIERAVDLNMNMLRIWGGGLYESDEFYQLCDEYGILVWQDFLFACAYYPDEEKWQKELEIEAAENIKRLRNHASLAVWCGNNENETMWYSKWGGIDQSPDRYMGEPLYLQTIPKVLGELDPSRPYIPSSPTRGADPNSNEQGDQHYWDVWHGRGDWKYYSDSHARFSSEYGFASAMSLELWRETMEPEEEAPAGACARWHDKTGKTWEIFSGFVKLHYSGVDTAEDWVYHSQLNQRDALRFALEHYRRSPQCRGSLIWQMNDIWPVQSWAFVDFSGRYKAAAYELRRLHDDVLVCLNRKNENVEIWLANDSDDAVTPVIVVEARNLLTGELVKEWEPAEAELDADSRALIQEIELTGLNGSETILTVDLYGSPSGSGTWRLLSDPKECRFACPDLRISTHSEGFIEIEHDAPVVDLWLSSEDPDVIFEENCVTQVAPGRFLVAVSQAPTDISARSLGGDHKVKLVRGPL